MNINKININQQKIKIMQNLEKITLRKENTEFKRVQIKNSETSATFLKQFYFDDIEIFESFFILLLNRNNETIGYAKISQGGVAGTVVDAKIILKYVIDTLASAVVLCHNHPSGNLTPSEADKRVTKTIKDACKLLDTELLDHIILTKDNYFSFADNGLI